MKDKTHTVRATRIDQVVGGTKAGILKPMSTQPDVSTPPMDPAAVLPARILDRMRNLTRPKNWYMAVAEAMKNAMDSIEGSGRNGKIEVTLIRGSALLTEDGKAPPIRDVIVRDTGAGFHQRSFDSFRTPDSAHKAQRGGKGLGRLVCLQTFQWIEGTSVYQEGDVRLHREFRLQCSDPEISHRVQNPAPDNSGTEVRLMNLRDEYQSGTAFEFDRFVNWIAQHFLPALVDRPAWLTEIKLVDGEQSVDLMSKISGGALWAEEFTLKNYRFVTSCYSLDHDERGDQVRVVAGGRVVDANTRGIDHYLPHVESVCENDGHVLLIRSQYFDEHVNDARNGISFADEKEDLSLLSVTLTQFRNEVTSVLQKRLASRIKRSDDLLRARVRETVRKEAPNYRPLLEGYFESKEFSALTMGCRDEEVLTSIDVFKRRVAAGFKKESRRLAKLHAESDGYAEAAKQLADQIEAQKKVALAEYVSLRKIVLDRLSDLLNARGDGKAHREANIHNLIFPQRTDSQNSPDFEHQLWILDERLESNQYLASDRPLKGNKGDRPDILVALDTPSVFASHDGAKAKGYDRFSIVEFKRPLLDVATAATDDLPHRQMMRYARQIAEGKTVHAGTGRAIKATADARYYMYAICELPASLLERLQRDEDFTPSPSGEGAYSVKNGKYYLEYISLDKLLEDAKARNAAFFRRLDLD